MHNQIAYFNGLDPDTGDYYVPPVALETLAARIGTDLGEKRHLVALRNFLDRLRKPKLGPIFGVDPAKLNESGWGIVFHRDESESVRRSLDGLISHRNGKIFEYVPGQSKDEWLRRQGLSPGSVDPKKVPYYLLIIGEPTRIPFEFQYHLDVQFAVGRISFDTPQEYSRYAHSVIRHDSSEPNRLPRKYAVFGTAHNGDRATNLSSTYLARPIATEVAELAKWSCHQYIGETATKESLLGVLKDSQSRASLLFAACHGIGYHSGDSRQLQGQGAWVCQNWPGRGSLEPGHLFRSEDVHDSWDLSAKVIFSFCCFGAGTPLHDDFKVGGGSIASQPFISSLPKKLLSHPSGGVLAYIGHIDRAWGYSFLWDGIGAQPQTMISVLCAIAAGTRLGHALSEINIRYAELSTMLVDALYQAQSQKTIPDGFLEHLSLWMARNDARNYILLGDPAVRLT